MTGLTRALVVQACRIFLAHAYPNGPDTIPSAKRPYLGLDERLPLASLLVPPVCEELRGASGAVRGYALRLGSVTYPHLKMQMIDCDQRGTWVFAVDTHDQVQVTPGLPDAVQLAEVQAMNRLFKAEIEQAWEAAGLLTFNQLLRQELGAEDVENSGFPSTKGLPRS